MIMMIYNQNSFPPNISAGSVDQLWSAEAGDNLFCVDFAASRNDAEFNALFKFEVV